MIRAALVGISGYAGMELARLLTIHPKIKLTMACSRAEQGKKLGEFYPFLKDLPGSDIVISVYEAEECARLSDIVFLAVPAGTALRMVPELLRAGLKVVDFSADYRLKDPQVYERWYNHPHDSADELASAVYGLPELYGEQIAAARIVANPGCYPTASILGAYAALKNNLIETDGIVIDAKSGASGAGRKAAIATLFCEVSDNFRPYGAPLHRHTPEIEQEYSRLGAREIRLSFVPHLVPMKRGILTSIYARLKKPISSEEIQRVFSETWRDKPWIRVLPRGAMPETVNTRGSMFCDIGFALDERTSRLVIFSAIDNLCRGAAGQALANANLMCGLPMDAGMENLCPLV